MKHLAAAVLVSLASSFTVAAQPGAKIRVILIDGQNNHDWRATTPILKQVLERSGRCRVAVSSDLRPGDRPGRVADTVPFPPDLSRYDVLVSNFNGALWPAGFRRDLESRLRAGKIDLVIVHAANNSFPDWPEYNRMIGLGWRDNNFGDRLYVDAAGKEVRVPKGKGPGAGHGAKHAFTVTIRDADHPCTRSMPHEWLHMPDELYHGQRGPAEHMHLLATAYSDPAKGGTGAHEPMIWTLSYGKGRVFHTPMGHDTEAMRCRGFQATLERGMEWAATGRVTLALPKDFPTAEKTSAVPER
jgi:hypothetical protein